MTRFWRRAVASGSCWKMVLGWKFRLSLTRSSQRCASFLLSMESTMMLWGLDKDTKLWDNV